MEVNGIKFAFLGYMEHTNGNYLSGDGAQVIYLDEEDKIKAQGVIVNDFVCDFNVCRWCKRISSSIYSSCAWLCCIFKNVDSDTAIFPE